MSNIKTVLEKLKPCSYFIVGSSLFKVSLKCLQTCIEDIQTYSIIKTDNDECYAIISITYFNDETSFICIKCEKSYSKWNPNYICAEIYEVKPVEVVQTIYQKV